MSDILTEIIAAKGWCLADGATATNLFFRGLAAGYAPELWAVEQPDEIRGLHDSFIQAGADLILTNSFGGTGFRLKLHKAQDRVEELNRAAARLARGAADAHFAERGRRIAVAGSIGPSGELFEPLGPLTHSIAKDGFAEQATALAAGGVDLIWIETMSSNEEVAAAIDAAKTTGLPICATMTFDTARRSMMGVTPADFARFAAAQGVDFMGANCGVGPAELMHSVREILAAQAGAAAQEGAAAPEGAAAQAGAAAQDIPAAHAGAAAKAGAVPVAAKGNCGIPAWVDGTIDYHGTPELMADYALFARDAGAQIIGGCCGTSPAHVAAMNTALCGTPARAFDAAAMTAALGEAWAGLETTMPDGVPRGARRGRRSGARRDGGAG